MKLGVREDLEGKKWGGHLITACLYAYVKSTSNKNKQHTIINTYLDQFIDLYKQPLGRLCKLSKVMQNQSIKPCFFFLFDKIAHARKKTLPLTTLPVSEPKQLDPSVFWTQSFGAFMVSLVSDSEFLYTV